MQLTLLPQTWVCLTALMFFLTVDTNPGLGQSDTMEEGEKTQQAEGGSESDASFFKSPDGSPIDRLMSLSDQKETPKRNKGIYLQATPLEYKYTSTKTTADYKNGNKFLTKTSTTTVDSIGGIGLGFRGDILTFLLGFNRNLQSDSHMQLGYMLGQLELGFSYERHSSRSMETNVTVDSKSETYTFASQKGIYVAAGYETMEASVHIGFEDSETKSEDKGTIDSESESCGYYLTLNFDYNWNLSGMTDHKAELLSGASWDYLSSDIKTFEKNAEYEAEASQTELSFRLFTIRKFL